MSGYKCINCGKLFEDSARGAVRCPSCAYRVVEKVRPAITKTISAR